MAGDHGILIFPHQLFHSPPAWMARGQLFLLEDAHFFSALRFHKQKLVLHRASMQSYARRLKRNRTVHYLPHSVCTKAELLDRLREAGIKTLHTAELCDHALTGRVRAWARDLGAGLHVHPTPMFLTPAAQLDQAFMHRERWHMAGFYRTQRRRLDILMNNGKPAGGQWSYDAENRKRLPPGLTVPGRAPLRRQALVRDAIDYVNTHFPDHPGQAEAFHYPVNHRQAAAWLENFLHSRLSNFGPYEDAMSQEQTFLFHSVLTPLLNIGLLTPAQVLEAVLDFGRSHDISLASLEGFIRQIIGWREFVWGVYRAAGLKQRRQNYWGFDNKLPQSFYRGSTGILPVDTVIQRVLDHAYCHHIERLMVLGNFMLLCEIEPDQVYQWFMELFIDAYDWVMVPNVYGMSQYADGGWMTTKPYISSSNYIRKMSDYPKGPWCDIWDGLYWRFVGRHQHVLAGNPRLRMMAVQWDKMDSSKKSRHLNMAESYLKKQFI
jgi:deoxyribodipyrimidine photolyase-related protein